ncbi:hypothetical protein SCP_0301890 [Sparassis crispa]|uniref:Uncharacterized protein n=1 Tax=Sparassis crispa TaxID=139825 RepID=A0A401GE62_9APHY|nr:hypothetical protein SCP_0301890 [Sparassis crispa]GBE80474.1 hypothetical protein SCP_0301890 [Sparassis crispa]
MATFWDIEQGLIMCAVPALRVVPHYSANQTFIDFMDVLVGRPSICSTIVVGYPKMFGRRKIAGDVDYSFDESSCNSWAFQAGYRVHDDLQST